MLITFVALYMIVSVAVGLYAARKVHSSSDYVVAGRSLPLYITMATVFATWFGSETVLGISSTFIDEGLGGIIADPFGAGMCLILVGLFFAKPLYRMKLLTISDFYKRRYGRPTELAVSIFICISYLGWVSAQIVALGLVFNIVTHDAISQDLGMVLGLAIVLFYTFFGGMFSVAMTDFMQMTIILIGMGIVAYFISNEVGGAGAVINHAVEQNKFSGFWPELTLSGVLTFIAAWVTMGFGSIPQQDVFQRVMSAKDEKTAVRGSVLGGSFYILFAFVPIFLGYSALMIDPETTAKLMEEDSQQILPTMILNHTPIWVQVMFFGALLSAIMSTASGTLLAPSVVFAENIVKSLLPHMTDKKLLHLIRGTVVGFSGLVLVYAFNSERDIFSMVEDAYKITLAGAFVPLAAGVYWKRANTAGATLSIIFGVGTWLLMEKFSPEGDGICPPQLAGLLAATFGMILGGYIGKPAGTEQHHQFHHGEKAS
ncbi:MAG: sodium:solute symporter [Alphaproteobacteria bacterium CG1_02_46_17]|nr:MAG: sodium:solute symporter [Alphaproteobacteria bacterium CG1_02_46_17]